MSEQPRSQTEDKGWTAPAMGSLRSTDARPLQHIFTSLREFLKENSETLSPAGIIMPYAGLIAPNGWLLCDGADTSRTTYSSLFSVFGTNFVGATTTNGSATISGLSGMVAATHIGWGIAGNGIPSGAIILTVTNATTVIISASATATQTGTASIAISPYGFTGANNTSTFLLPDMRGRVGAGRDSMGGSAANRLTNKSVFTGATTTSGSATVSGLSGMSASIHVGLSISGSGIPANAVINSVTNTTTVVISANATITQSGTATVTISTGGVDGSILGSVGGSQSHLLLSAQSGLPAHNHTTGNDSPDHHHLNYSWMGSYQASAFQYGYDPYNAQIRPTSGASARHTHTVNNNIATNAAIVHNIVQPTLVLNYIIKA